MTKIFRWTVSINRVNCSKKKGIEYVNSVNKRVFAVALNRNQWQNGNGISNNDSDEQITCKSTTKNFVCFLFFCFIFVTLSGKIRKQHKHLQNEVSQDNELECGSICMHPCWNENLSTTQDFRLCVIRALRYFHFAVVTNI